MIPTRTPFKTNNSLLLLNKFSYHTNTAQLTPLLWDVAGALLVSLKKQTDKQDKTPVPWSKANIKEELLLDLVYMLHNQ